MKKKDRREFINIVLGGGVTLLSGSVLYPVIKYMTPPEVSEAETSSVLAGTVDEMGPGTGKAFRFGSKPGLLVRLESGEFNAFIAVCTHLGCIVQYDKEKNGIWCACHGGLFDNFGNVVSGPPPSPLTPLKVTIQGKEIHVSQA